MLTTTNKIFLTVLVIVLIGVGIFLGTKKTETTSGWIEENGIMTYKSKLEKPDLNTLGGYWIESNCIHTLNATTTTATSDWVNVSDANRISVYFQRSDDVSGSTAFTIDVSPNASDYDVYERLILNQDNTDSNNQDRVSSTTIAGDETIFLSFSPEDVPNFIRINATETTDGKHDAWFCAQKSN